MAYSREKRVNLNDSIPGGHLKLKEQVFPQIAGTVVGFDPRWSITKSAIEFDTSCWWLFCFTPVFVVAA